MRAHKDLWRDMRRETALPESAAIKLTEFASEILTMRLKKVKNDKGYIIEAGLSAKSSQSWLILSGTFIPSYAAAMTAFDYCCEYLKDHTDFEIIYDV